MPSTANEQSGEEKVRISSPFKKKKKYPLDAESYILYNILNWSIIIIQISLSL